MDCSILIELDDFFLPIYKDENPEKIKTALRLDSINLPSLSLLELQGKTLNFPTNPDEGYIDASIYIEHAHHPADITKIKFGNVENDEINVEILVIFIFDFEGLGDYSNAEWKCFTKLKKG